MPSGVAYTWPPDDELLELYRESGGNYSELARRLGIVSETVRGHVAKNLVRKAAFAQVRQDRATQLRAPARDPEQRPGAEVDGDEGKIVSPPSAKPQDIPTLLRHWDLDPDEWEVRDVKVNTWDALTSDKATGDNRVVRMHQMTVYLRKRLELALVQPAVHVPALVRPRAGRRLTTRPRLVVVEGDHQAPYEDQDLDGAVTGFVQDLQPDVHVFLGDTGDYSTISKHPDHPAANATPQDSLDGSYALLRRRAEAAPNAERKKLKGNHDWRLEGEQLARSERLYGLKPAAIEDSEQLAAFSLRNLLHLDALGVELVEDPRGWEHGEVELVDGPRGLVVRHGWLTGHKTAERSMKKRGRSLIVGHGHHREHAFWWDPSAEIERQAAMCGVMCLARSVRFPHYQPCDDQLQGALTVTIYPDGQFVIEHARWSDGALLWRDSRYTARSRRVKAAA
jgi:hypothetical protein